MDIEQFRVSLKEDKPPLGVTPALKAMWFDARGEWDDAHHCVQDDPSPDGAWVHAYLHRKEGDQYNARYWYQRASRPIPGTSLAEEWEMICQTLLEEDRKENVR